jgi:hypothetical protein
MLVSVAQDGTTQVANQEGHVYVSAKGVEVTIPVGDVSTVVPGQPPAAPQLQPSAKVNTDTTDDVFDSLNRAIGGYQYLDIVSETTDYTGGTWTFTIKLNAKAPDTVAAPGVVEYDIMVDADNDIKTGWQSTALFNDLGIDYYIYVSEAGSKFSCMVINTGTSIPVPDLVVNYSAIGDTVQISFNYNLAGSGKNYSYIVLARQYSKMGDPASLLAVDKLPNVGHFTAPD